MPNSAPRGNNDHLQKDIAVYFQHPQVTATTTLHVFKARAACKVTRVEYCNPTGLAEDAGNTFKGEVKNGATVISTVFDTDSDLAGTNTLVANAMNVPAITDANAAVAAGDTVDLVLTEQGIATLPAGYGIVWIREV